MDTTLDTDGEVEEELLMVTFGDSMLFVETFGTRCTFILGDSTHPLLENNHLNSADGDLNCVDENSFDNVVPTFCHAAAPIAGHTKGIGKAAPAIAPTAAPAHPEIKSHNLPHRTFVPFRLIAYFLADRRFHCSRSKSRTYISSVELYTISLPTSQIRDDTSSVSGDQSLLETFRISSTSVISISSPYDSL